MLFRRLASMILGHCLLACAAAPSPAAAVPRSRHTDPTLGGDPSSMEAGRVALGGASGDRTLSGRAGGPMPFSSIGASCTGYGTATPSHVVWIDRAVPMLTLRGSSEIDTVMVVRVPSGEMLCNDDGDGYPNPLVTTPGDAGRYDIWVGTYSAGNSGDYTVTISSASGG